MLMTNGEKQLESIGMNMYERAIRMGIPAWDAEDLVQEAFVRFYAGRFQKEVLPPKQQKTALEQFFLSGWTRWLRDRRQERENLTAHPENLCSDRELPEERCLRLDEKAETQDIYVILKELFRMKKQMRDVLELTALFKFSEEETCRILGISPEDLHKRLKSARQELRFRLRIRGIDL